MNLLYPGIIIVVLGLIVMATQVPGIEDTVNTDVSNAKQMIGTILDTGAMATFDQAISAPTTEFLYQETEQIIISTLTSLQLRELVEQLPVGEYKDYVLSLTTDEQKALFTRIQTEIDLTVQEQQILDVMEIKKADLATTNQTETVIEEILVSELELTSADRQTGIIKKCKIGNQCDITGKIVLIDNQGNLINGPYTLFFSLDCELLDYCNLNPIGINKKTEPDGTWMYSTTLKPSSYLAGKYDAFSRGTIEKDGISYWIEGSGIVEVVQ